MRHAVLSFVLLSSIAHAAPDDRPVRAARLAPADVDAPFWGFVPHGAAVRIEARVRGDLPLDRMGVALVGSAGLHQLTGILDSKTPSGRDYRAATLDTTVGPDVPVGRYEVVLTLDGEPLDDGRVRPTSGTGTLTVTFAPDPGFLAEVAKQTGQKLDLWAYADALSAPWEDRLLLPEVDDEVVVASSSRYDRGVQAAVDGRLAELSPKERTDPVAVARHLARPTPQHLLWGRWDGGSRGSVPENAWDGPWREGQEPWSWTDTSQVLRASRPKYGQCWVFASVTTAVYRSLGLPSRSVTNVDSAHEHLPPDTVPGVLQAIDAAPYGTTRDACLATSAPPTGDEDDSVWNVHVWTEVWLPREGGGGWNAVDSTAQERGSTDGDPVPVAQILSGKPAGAVFTPKPQPPVRLPVAPASVTADGVGLRVLVAGTGQGEHAPDAVAKALDAAVHGTFPAASGWSDATGHLDLRVDPRPGARLAWDPATRTIPVAAADAVLLLVDLDAKGTPAFDPVEVELLTQATSTAVLPLLLLPDGLPEEVVAQAEATVWRRLLRGEEGQRVRALRKARSAAYRGGDWDDLLDEAMDQVRENPLWLAAVATSANPLYEAGQIESMNPLYAKGDDPDDDPRPRPAAVLTVRIGDGAVYPGDCLELLGGPVDDVASDCGGRTDGLVQQVRFPRGGEPGVAQVRVRGVDAEALTGVGSYVRQGALTRTKAAVGPIRWMAPEAAKAVAELLGGDLPEEGFVTGHGAQVSGVYSEKAAFMSFDDPTPVGVGTWFFAIREGGRTIGAGQVTEIIE